MLSLNRAINGRARNGSVNIYKPMNVCARLAALAAIAILPGCITMPVFDRSADIPAEFREDIDAIDSYPVAANLPPAPQQLTTTEEWDDRAGAILAVKADLALKASLPVPTPEQIRARRTALLAKLNAFKLDDPT